MGRAAELKDGQEVVELLKQKGVGGLDDDIGTSLPHRMVSFASSRQNGNLSEMLYGAGGTLDGARGAFQR